MILGHNRVRNIQFQHEIHSLITSDYNLQLSYWEGVGVLLLYDLISMCTFPSFFSMKENYCLFLTMGVSLMWNHSFTFFLRIILIFCICNTISYFEWTWLIFKKVSQYSEFAKAPWFSVPDHFFHYHLWLSCGCKRICWCY